jgi:HNH endonuclease
MVEYFSIELSQGQACLVSVEDFDKVSARRWHARHDNSGKFYACRAGVREDGRKTKFDMHRELLSPPAGYQVDHINGNSLDNRRENLRIATASENGRNRGPNKNNTTGIKGVSLIKGKFVAQLTLHRKNRIIGRFPTLEAAGKAVKSATARLHGEFGYVA